MKEEELRDKFKAEKPKGVNWNWKGYALWLEKYAQQKSHQNKCHSCGKSMSDHCPRCEMFQKI